MSLLDRHSPNIHEVSTTNLLYPFSKSRSTKRRWSSTSYHSMLTVISCPQLPYVLNPLLRKSLTKSRTGSSMVSSYQSTVVPYSMITFVLITAPEDTSLKVPIPFGTLAAPTLLRLFTIPILFQQKRFKGHSLFPPNYDVFCEWYKTPNVDEYKWCQ